MIATKSLAEKQDFIRSLGLESLSDVDLDPESPLVEFAIGKKKAEYQPILDALNELKSKIDLNKIISINGFHEGKFLTADNGVTLQLNLKEENALSFTVFLIEGCLAKEIKSTLTPSHEHDGINYMAATIKSEDLIDRFIYEVCKNQDFAYLASDLDAWLGLGMDELQISWEVANQS